jgi:hypothetical protein
MRRLVTLLVATGVLVLFSVLSVRPVIVRAQGGDTATSPNVWFHDDFSTRANRWRLVDLEKAVVTYDESGLNMRATPANYALWSIPDTDLKLERYNIEVDAKFGKGSSDARVGVIIGYRTDNDMLVLAVSRLGNVYLGRYYFGVWTDVLRPSKVKLDPTKIVTLRASIDKAHSLRIFVNGQQAGRTTIKDFRASSFGLFALSGKQGGVDVAFSRFVVSDSQ